MKTVMKFLMVQLLATATASMGWGQIIHTYNFTDVASGSSSSSAGATVSNLTFSSFTSTGVSATANAASRFSFTGWSTGATTGSDTFTGALDATDYYQFSITPDSGYEFTLSSITFTLQRSGTGIRQYAVRSSADNYAANLTASIAPANPDLSVVATNVFQVADTTSSAETGSTITLSGVDYTSLTGSISFRFYGWNAEASGGTFSVDDVAISGAVTAIPEPATLALLGLGAAVVGAGCRRKRA